MRDHKINNFGFLIHGQLTKGTKRCSNMPPFDIIDDACSQGSLHTASSGPRLEEMCGRARDEANRLRIEVCTLRIRVEELEEERNYHAVKANELTSVIKINDGEGINAELVKKTMQVVELKNEIQRLKAEKEEMAQENARIQRQRDSAHQELQDLSVVVRSLQTSAYAEEEPYDSEDEEKVIELTAAKALDMTLSNMKAHIEVLEDALQTRTAQYKDCKKKAARLQKDNEMSMVKIDMLEELFRDLNQRRSDEEVRKDQEIRFDAVQTAPEARFRYNKSLLVPSLKIGERMRRSFERKENLKTEEPSTSASTETVDSASLPREKMQKIKICFRKAGLEGMYTGPVKEGLPHGVGTIRFTSGDTYLGEMKEGKMSGKGTLYTKSRGIFRGNFESNKFVS